MNISISAAHKKYWKLFWQIISRVALIVVSGEYYRISFRFPRQKQQQKSFLYAQITLSSTSVNSLAKRRGELHNRTNAKEWVKKKKWLMQCCPLEL